MDAGAQSQYLVFQVAAREYALPIENIVEVLRMVALAPLAHSPAWLSGVVNLRGRVIPVIDLRILLGLPAQAIGLTTPLIIISTQTLVAGLIADSASEVLGVAPEQIEPPSGLGGDGHLLSGIARVGARLVFVLDSARLAPELLPRLTEPPAR